MAEELRLVRASRKEIGDIELVYDGKHSNDKTTLHFQVTVTQTPSGFSASIDFGDSLGPKGVTEGTAQNAIMRLGAWCERASKTLLNFKPDQTIPL